MASPRVRKLAGRTRSANMQHATCPCAMRGANGKKSTKKPAKRDACYRKVKARYSVWPSAYASGALVKCRKVGAANWGNSSNKKKKKRGKGKSA